MDTDQLLDRVAKILMTTYLQTTPWNEGTKDNILEAHSIRPSRVSDRKYRLGPIALATAETASKVFVSGLDNYPIKPATDMLIEAVVAVQDEGLPIRQVESRLREVANERFTKLSQLAEWEFLTPIAGMYLEAGPIKLGRCRFQVFDEQELRRWAQRYSTGKYDPPANAPIHQSALDPMFGLCGNPNLVGQVVAVVRIGAADANHAEAAGEAVIEEALNLLRYGQITLAGFGWAFPEIRIRPPESFSCISFCFPIANSQPNGPSTRSRFGGTEGHPVGLVNQAPGWCALDAMLHKPRPNRTEIESRLTTALLWCGNAALSTADAVRLASLVTALEAMLLQKGESKGKKAKLIKRTRGLLGPGVAADTTDEVYSVRSDCIHNGENVVEDHVMDSARRLVAECIGKLTGDSRFAGCATLDQLLNVIDPTREQVASDD